MDTKGGYEKNPLPTLVLRQGGRSLTTIASSTSLNFLLNSSLQNLAMESFDHSAARSSSVGSSVNLSSRFKPVRTDSK